MNRTIDMLRDLEDLPPPVALPAGCRLVTAAQVPGFAPLWAELLNLSFEDGDWTPEKLDREFMSRPQFAPAGLFFGLVDGAPASVALAWRNDPAETVRGLIHYVGTAPAERGKGLGRAVVVGVMHYLRARGLREVYLGTQQYRVPAVRLYLSLGFRPWPHNEEDEAVWAVGMQRQRWEEERRGGVPGGAR
jgi:mycothiol synthase